VRGWVDRDGKHFRDRGHRYESFGHDRHCRDCGNERLLNACDTRPDGRRESGTRSFFI
jgi:hypothetical protein